MTLVPAAYRASGVLVRLTALAAIALAAAAPAQAQTQNWPATIRAAYDVNFNGFNVGTFDFQAQAEQQSYTLTASASLSFLLGAITWNGETRSFGLIVNQVPKPAAFAFDVKAGSRASSTKLGFVTAP